SVKFNPSLGKEEIKTQSSGGIFAKIPQELKPEATHEVLSKVVLPQDANLGMGSTNQITKIIFPAQPPNDDSKAKENKNYINIPIIKQPFGDYNIIVATAPKNVRIGKGKDAKPVVIYVVFPDEGGDPKSPNIPSIYFVTKLEEPLPFQKKKEDPILVIDSNRTVTGLKSKAMTKFVKFKNKMTNQFETS
ncbi:jg24965, partial [Pararge aegeria aegeria]